MVQNLRGELTESSNTNFQHPVDEQLSPQVATLASLSYAIGEGNIQMVDEILSSSKRFLLNDADYLGNTPLHVAVTNAKSDIVRTLLSKGASVHMRNKMNQTPLDIASSIGNTENVEVLLQAGAHDRPQ